MVRTRLFSGLLVLTCAWTPRPVEAQAQCTLGRITEIVFDVDEPFDEGATSEDARLGWLFRSMNWVHIRTRVRTVGWELLFSEGDCFDPTVLAESERSLRSLRYISKADISSERLPSGDHRVFVKVQDSWAITGGLELSSNGGVAVTGVSANARNVFGTGTRLGLFRTGFRDRRRMGLIARQPNLFGTRVDGAVHGGTTRSGAYLNQSLLRPYAGELGSGAFRQVARSRDDYFSYSLDPSTGYTQALVRFEEERYELSLQRRFGDDQGLRLVTGVGVSREDIRFAFGEPGVLLVSDNAFDAPGASTDSFRSSIRPQTRDHAASRVSITLGLRDLSLGNVLGLDALQAPQDVVNGATLVVTAAPALSLEGSDASDVFFRAQGLWGRQTDHTYMRISGDLQTRRVGMESEVADPLPHGWRDLVYELSGRAYWLPSGGTRIFTRVSYTAGYNLDRPFQLTLGGREGVRSYNDDAYPAARRLLATVEQRFAIPQVNTGWADVGIAFFADVGRGWAGEVPFGEDSGWRAGGGVGLRFGLPSGGTDVLRLDVGLPISGERGEKGVLFRVYTELLGLLDRRSWPTQVERSRWYGADPDLTARPYDPLAGN